LPKLWLEDPDTRPGASFLNVRDFIGIPLTGVTPLAEHAPTPNIHVKSSPADYFECGVLRLMSAQLVSLLSSSDHTGREMEFLPIQLMGEVPDGEYFLGHTLVQVDCIDRGGARFTERDGVIDRIEHLTLLPEAAVQRGVFRVANTFEFLTCVDDDLAELLGHRTTGSKFIEPREWRW
jgi:hypothetical protein